MSQESRTSIVNLLKQNLNDAKVKELIVVDINAIYNELVKLGFNSEGNNRLDQHMKSLYIFEQSGDNQAFKNFAKTTVNQFMQNDYTINLYLDDYLVNGFVWPHPQGSLLALGKILKIKIHSWIEVDDQLIYRTDLLQEWDNSEVHIILNGDSNHFSKIEMEQINNMNLEFEVALKYYNLQHSLCIDASIYDPNYHKAFEKLAVNLQLIITEVSHNTISTGYYIMDNIYGKSDNSANNKVPLMIEDEPHIKPQSSAKASINFNVLYKSAISFKGLDFIVDTLRFVNEPNIENTQKLLRGFIHLQSIFEGNNMYSMALSAIDISHQFSKGEFQEAGVQAITSISYMAIPTMLSVTGIPYLGFAYGSLMAGYSGYHAVNNAYSLYLEYGTAEWQLKSVIAYSELYKFLANSSLQHTYDFASNAKQYEIKANTIKLEMEKTQIKLQLDAKGEFGNKLYEYIHAPMLEEKYDLLNKVISGELTEDQAAAMKAKHISMTLGEQHYEHCMEVKNDVVIVTSEEYYCYNENQQILDHILVGHAGVVETIERL